MYDYRAAVELAEIKDRTERKAIYSAIEKLRAFGDALPFPHQSKVKGGKSVGLRELRPRRGDSPYRPLYRQFERWFVVLAIAKKDDYDQQVKRAAAREEEYES